jgi:hypothetical protein
MGSTLLAMLLPVLTGKDRRQLSIEQTQVIAADLQGQVAVAQAIG